MSTKYFCDCCGKELVENKNQVPWSTEHYGRLHGKYYSPQIPKNTLKFEITVGLNDTFNSGHFCKYCIIDAVNSTDDRPKAFLVSDTNQGGL